MWYNKLGDCMEKHLKIQELLKAKEIDAILVSNPSNIFYFSNFTGTNAKLLLCEDQRYLITDFRYKQQAESLNTGYTVLCTDDKNTLVSIINKLRKKLKFNSLALEGNYITRNTWLDYERNLTMRLSDLNIDGIRNCKSDAEVEIIRQSINIAEKAFKETLKFIEVGKSEKDIALYLEFKMLEYGAESIAFDTIVASGERGALPHGVASSKLISNNELITFDFGCKYKGYCSDITRTVAVGNVSDELLEVYETVKTANELGIETVRAGLSGKEVDKVVRDYINSKGYEGKFGHGLGHSIGIDIHEDPRLRNDVDHILHSGNVVTIEPGIYIEGVGGVRIEDDVLLKEDSIEVLTSLEKDLIII